MFVPEPTGFRHLGRAAVTREAAVGAGVTGEPAHAVISAAYN